MKKFLSVALVLIISLVCFTSCKDEGKKENETEITENPIATIEMENGGVMKVELYYDKAPNTVKNFISLANKGFYNGLIFHRVIPDFMIQGGDPNGIGNGGPGYCIKGEFSNNGFENDISHKRGTISMARTVVNDSAGSQFFICVADCPFLDKEYAAFGYCFEGMDVADEIVSQKTDGNDKPLEDIVIKTISIDMKGQTIGEPETLPER